MSCYSKQKQLTATAIALMILLMPASLVQANGTSTTVKLNPYLADCYRNVTYIGTLGHHFSITLPHTNTCSVDQKKLPPGLALKGCDLEGTPSAAGKWDFPVVLESFCHGINFGKVSIPITVLINE